MVRAIACAMAVALSTCAAVAQEPALSRPWTGFYMGAGIGGGAVVQEQALNITGVGTVFADTAGGQGLIATATTGYDYQVTRNVVAGLFADFDWSTISADYFDPLSVTFDSADHTYSWALGARLGYLATPTTLWYLTAGYTQAAFDFGVLGSFDLQGYFVGGGVESRLASNWSMRGEYRFSHFQPETVLDLCLCGSLEIENTMHTGRLLLIYRFDNGSPAPP